MIQKTLLALTSCLLSIFSTGQNQQQLKIDSSRHREILQRIYEVITANYVFPDKAPLITQHIKKQQASGKYAENTNQGDFASSVTQDIRAIYNDSHLRIVYDP